MKDFNQYMKAAVASMWKDGVVTEVESLNGRRVPLEARPLLKRLVHLVMDTDYTKPDTKLYLVKSYGMRLVGGEGCASNRNSSRSRIQYDITKLKAALGADFFDRIVEGGDLCREAEALAKLERKARGRSLLEGYLFPLPSPTGELEALDGEQLERLRRLTKLFGSARANYWRKQFTPEMLNYLNYLNNHREQLSEENQATYDRLREYMK